MGCEEKGCLGFAHDGIGLGLELEHQAGFGLAPDGNG